MQPVYYDNYIEEQQRRDNYIQNLIRCAEGKKSCRRQEDSATINVTGTTCDGMELH